MGAKAITISENGYPPQRALASPRNTAQVIALGSLGWNCDDEEKRRRLFRGLRYYNSMEW